MLVMSWDMGLVKTWMFWQPSSFHSLSGGRPMEIDEQKVEDTVLALLYLTTFKDKPRWRAWKSHSWDVLDRLHQKGYISDPATKAKSVLLTEEGAQRSRDLFDTYFATYNPALPPDLDLPFTTPFPCLSVFPQ